MNRLESSRFIENTLNNLKGKIKEKKVEGVTTGSNIFKIAMDEYRHYLSSTQRTGFREQYSQIMKNGGNNLLIR
jgi:hypothetical protein